MALEKIYGDLEDGVLTSLFHDADTGQIIERYEGNNQRQLAHNKYMQDNTSDWKKFDSKKEYHPVLDLTMVDVMRLRDNHGIDILGNDIDWKEVFKVIDTYYPYMKTTTAKLA